MNNLRKIFTIVAIAAAVGITASAVTANNLAYAAINSVDSGCTNGGGQSPGGQQPTCTGGGLTQQTQNQNPAGSAPPGQNK